MVLEDFVGSGNLRGVGQFLVNRKIPLEAPGVMLGEYCLNILLYLCRFQVLVMLERNLRTSSLKLYFLLRSWIVFRLDTSLDQNDSCKEKRRNNSMS